VPPDGILPVAKLTLCPSLAFCYMPTLHFRPVVSCIFFFFPHLFSTVASDPVHEKGKFDPMSHRALGVAVS